MLRDVINIRYNILCIIVEKCISGCIYSYKISAHKQANASLIGRYSVSFGPAIGART